MVIKWRNEDQRVGKVHFGLSPDELFERVEKESDSFNHEILLENLVPDTRYFYQLIDFTDSVHSFRTPPVEGEARPTRVWVLGDSGTADSNARNVRNAFETFNGGSTTDLVLMLGDNAYDSGADCEYQKAFFDMYPSTIAETPVMPTIGNHDAREDGGSPYLEIFTLPSDGKTGGVPSGTESYYSFNFSNIHFVSLDSETSDRSPTGAMYNWLLADLAANTQDWTVVYFHHPPYSKGTHDSDIAGAMSDMREHYTAVFEAYGVDLVFTGHSHNYERSFPIKGHRGMSDTFLESMKTDGGDGRKDGDGAYTKPYNSVNQGIIYTVAGSSGKTRSAPLNHPVHYLSMSKLGSVVLDFDGDEVNVTFVSPDPGATDYYTLTKN
jgi:3',5'-cyclic AMP phosphodiesterase CpdA